MLRGRSLGFAHWIGLPIAFVLILLAASPAAVAQNCSEDITRSAALCVQQRGLDAALSCRQNAVRECNCNSATNQCVAAASSCGPELQAKAKINVDWIFADRGARATFESHRQGGESPFAAAVSAQAHNPPVQVLLRQCRSWVEAYLGRGDGCTLSDGPPGPAACRCISVLLTGQHDQTGAPSYKVTNSCADTFRIAVRFVDAVTSGAAASFGPAQLVCPGRSFVTRAPQTFQIPSIDAVGLQSGSGSYTCVCRGDACN